MHIKTESKRPKLLYIGTGNISALSKGLVEADLIQNAQPFTWLCLPVWERRAGGGLNRVFTCGGYKCPALLHKWPHKQPVARLGLEQYSVQMGIISPQLTIRPPPAKLWPSSITC